MARTSDSSTRGIDLRALAEAWETAGLPAEPVQPVADAVERTRAIRRDYASMREPDSHDVAGRIARAELSFAEGCREHLLDSASVLPVSARNAAARGTTLLDATLRQVDAIAVVALRERREAIAAILETARAELVDDVRALAPVLEGIGSAREATRAGSKQATAWGKLEDLEVRRHDLARVYATARTLGIVGESPLEFGKHATTARMVADFAGAVPA